MRECWKQSANQRPTFSLMREHVEMLLVDLSRDPHHNIDVSQMQENMLDILHNIPGEKC